MENDYRIYDIRKKEYWGPIYWDFLYLTALGFPITLSHLQSKQFSNLLQNFHVFLPCAECRYHYKMEISNLKLNVKTKEDAFNTVVYIHNKVRKRQKKKEWSKEDIISYHYSKQSNNKMYFIGISVILIIVYFSLNVRQAKKFV